VFGIYNNDTRCGKDLGVRALMPWRLKSRAGKIAKSTFVDWEWA